MSHLLHHIIVCDDVRREDNGKELLIGVYSGGIRFNGPAPGKLRTLCIRLAFNPDPTETKGELRFHLVSPSGATVINVVTQISLNRTARMVVVFTQEGLSLYEPGIYRLKLGLNAEPEEVDTVEVAFGERPQQAPPPAALQAENTDGPEPARFR